MNMKDFKKVKESEDRAHFKNSDGHLITIAKKGLSKKLLRQLSDLPLHAADGADIEEPEFLKKFHEAGPYSSQKIEDEAQRTRAKNALEANNEAIKSVAYLGDKSGWKSAQDRPAPEPIPEMPSGPMSTPQDAVSLAPEIEEPPPQQPMPQQAPQRIPQQAPQQQMGAPVASPEQDYQQRYEQEHARAVSQRAEMDAREDVAWARDMATGVVTPKTYHQLWAEKDTPSKILTLFGLLAGGIGSGLTKQPNAVLEMMNKEIDNDFKAQQLRKDNAMNYLKAARESAFSKAQVGLIGAQTQEALVNVAKNKALLSSINDMDMMVNKMPPGPGRANYESALAQVKTAATAQMMQNSQAAAQMMVSDPEGEFQRQQASLRKAMMLGVPGAGEMYRESREKYVPGSGMAQIPVPESARKELMEHEKLDAAASDLLSYSKKHTNLIPGTPEYNVGAQKALVLQQIVREGLLGTVFRDSEKPLLNKFVDENPAGALKMLSTQPKLKALLESNALNTNVIRKQYGLPEKSKKAESENVITTKSGRRAVMKNGKLVYQ